MWKRFKIWLDEYDLLALFLAMIMASMLAGAIIGKIVTNQYDSQLRHLQERVDIMQEHIVECIDDSICEHYRFE